MLKNKLSSSNITIPSFAQQPQWVKVRCWLLSLYVKLLLLACGCDPPVSPVLKAMNVSSEICMGAVRFSLGRTTTREEIEEVVSQL